jgi:hypothetical protein
LTTISNAPPGPYIVQFSDVAFYQTPDAQTNTLANGTTLTFTGDYTFIDVNSNHISDAWEKYYFGSVSPTRTQSTDSDGDGMSDYAEFIAGTDPTNSASKLVFFATKLLTNHLVQIQWSAVPGRLYQVLASSANLSSWTPVSDWLQAAGSPMSFNATNSAGPCFYRVQVRP